MKAKEEVLCEYLLEILSANGPMTARQLASMVNTTELNRRMARRVRGWRGGCRRWFYSITPQYAAMCLRLLRRTGRVDKLNHYPPYVWTAREVVE